VRGTADILVVGAGPAGLALALQAHDHGAAIRIVDRRPEAARPSRALILHPRTLEVLRPLGVTQALLARADVVPAADLQLGSRLIRVTLADLALLDTAFPHLSLVRQMDVERVLAEALADRGIEIERGTELTGLRGGSSGVRAILRSPATAEETWFDFVVGCDGPASTVRAQRASGGLDGDVRCPCLLPGYRSRDERRYPGRGQPRREARVRRGPAGGGVPAGLIRPGAPAGGAPGNGDDARGVLGRSIPGIHPVYAPHAPGRAGRAGPAPGIGCPIRT